MLERLHAAALPPRSRFLDRVVALAVLVACALSLVPSIADAQIRQRPRTVVLRFEGWRAEQARRAALDALEPGYEMVEEAQLIETAAQIAVDVSTPEGMAAVVERLGVVLVIGGFVEGTGRRSTTTVWVMDVGGNELARRTTTGPGSRSAAGDIGAAASEAATEALAVVHPPEPEPEPEVPGSHDPISDEPERPIDHEAPVDVSDRWNQPLVRALVGVRIRNRTAAVRPNERTNRFDAEFFPDIQLMVEARPFAMDPGALRGLYAALSGGFSAGLGYFRLPPNDIDPVAMQTANFGLDVGYGLVLAETFELVLSLGFGIDGFLLSEGTAADFPSVLYAFFRPAVQGRISIVQRSLLVAELGFGGRINVDAGEINRLGPDGTSSGGIDLYLGVAGQLDFGFSWAVRFAYTAYFLGFSGAPMASESASDEAIQFLLLVGWSF